MKEKTEVATFANGCFWCTEAVFQRFKGVNKVLSGFTGGMIKNPPYREVVSGRTGHAEALQITFNPDIITFKELLYVFFSTHDPTTLNRQGADVGTQYRSAIFYHSNSQKEMANAVIKELDADTIFNAPIVTEVTEASEFYVAEEEHQNFYNNHPEYGYCKFVIDPKINKIQKYFSDKLN
ncbi:peptide-methionine (S)-S-oxide reductase MsrA [Croceibacter atlanticus]|uniref:peptide-methionine (S)-S-oxide reductase MsrA n=1 Tax=Croceibacter atlanticus TaxID=313588 RepID=UPI0030F531CD